MSGWQLVVAAPAERALARVPESVAAAIVAFMLGPLLDDPARVGKPLQRELEGYRSARRGAYRVVYRIEDERGLVVVVRIEHRADVYRHR